MIYVGPHNDGGWSEAHDEGRLYVQKKLGKNVITTYKENVPEGPQASQVIDSLVRDGNKIIFATSFGYMDAMAAAAQKCKALLRARDGVQERQELCQLLRRRRRRDLPVRHGRGAASKNGLVGYVVPFPIPEIIRQSNGFALGVQATHPGAKIKIVWTKSWFDPAKEKKAAESLVAAGVDVIGQNVDSPAAGQYAQSKGIPWVGHGSYAQKFAPTSWLTAGLYDWGLYYLKRVKEAQSGTWKTGSYWGSMADGFTLIAPYGPKVSSKTKAMIASKRAAIISGKFYEFQGPLYDQSGKLRVPKGKTMTLPEILSVTGSSRVSKVARRADQGSRQQPGVGVDLGRRPRLRAGPGSAAACW